MKFEIMCKGYLLPTLLLLAAAGCFAPDKSELIEKQLVRVENAGTPKDPNALALSVAGRPVTSDQIVSSLAERLRPIAQISDFESFKKQARPHVEQVLTEKVSYVVLYERAKAEMGEKIDAALEKEADNEIRKVLARYGGDSARAEARLKEQGWDWDSYRELQKTLALISLQQPKARPVTYGDLVDCYNRMREESFGVAPSITLRVIDIQPVRLQATHSNPGALEEARKLANRLVEVIRAGEDFAKLARQYSHGHRRDFGGLWKPRKPDSLAEPYDLLAAEAEKLRPGEVGGPIESQGGQHIFIMRLEGKVVKGIKPLSDVQREVEYRILVERRKEAAEELDARLAELAALEQKDEFIDFCVGKAYRLAKQSS
ncbi:MAG: foldase protein PrsA [Planctomycetota bacterium]|jgi:parvulin-like peptidyl-prolyl isomerase